MSDPNRAAARAILDLSTPPADNLANWCKNDAHLWTGPTKRDECESCIAAILDRHRDERIVELARKVCDLEDLFSGGPSLYEVVKDCRDKRAELEREALADNDTIERQAVKLSAVQRENARLREAAEDLEPIASITGKEGNLAREHLGVVTRFRRELDGGGHSECGYVLFTIAHDRLTHAYGKITALRTALDTKGDDHDG